METSPSSFGAMFNPNTLLLLVISLLVTTIVIAKKTTRPNAAGVWLAVSGVCYLWYEWMIQHAHAEYNIRPDLLLIYGLFIFAFGATVSGGNKNNATAPQQSDKPVESSKCLYLALIGIPMYAFFVFSVAAVVLGHQAIARHPGEAMLKTKVGLVLGYLTILLGVAAWLG